LKPGPFFLAAAAAAALALLNLANLVAAGYGQFAARHLDRPDSTATLAAAAIAARLAPWASTHAALQGWVLAENRQVDGAHTAYGRALRLAPADPLLWGEYGLALARLGEFGEPLTVAIAQATRLGPTSTAVRRTVADLGLSYWARGTPAQQSAWLEGMRAELQRNRGTFLGHVLTRGQGQAFCLGPGRALGEDAWCARIASALLGGCFQLGPVEPQPCSFNP
jgi:Flp pilus assembly protein TadD